MPVAMEGDGDGVAVVAGGVDAIIISRAERAGAVELLAWTGRVEDRIHHLLRHVPYSFVERVAVQRIWTAAVTEALLDLAGVTLHLAPEGGMALLAAVLDDTQNLEFAVHIVLLQPLEQKLLQLGAVLDRRVRDPRDLVEHVARRGHFICRRGL